MARLKPSQLCGQPRAPALCSPCCLCAVPVVSMASKKQRQQKQRRKQRQSKKKHIAKEKANQQKGADSNGGAIYCRTSSKANEHGASMPRQRAAGQAEATMQKIPVIRTVCEVISGSLPMDQRKQFKTLLSEAPNRGIKKIFVESASCLLYTSPSPRD